MLLRKDQLEASLDEEKKLIEDGRLKEDNPLDLSEGFNKLCEACRRGDLKLCQEMITEGANINARDRFDYSPLILGERCLYNALNDRIRNLLLSYDYSKSTDPLQPFAAHITSLLTRELPQTSDILVTTASETFHLHKFVLSARSPFFRKRLSSAPETISWKIPPAIPPQAFGIAMRYVYLGEIPTELSGGPGTGFSVDEILEGIDKTSRHLEIRGLWDAVLESDDRRLSRQRRTEEVEKGRRQLEAWFLDNVMRHKVFIDTDKAEEVKWNRNNGIFADVLLQADQPAEDTNPNGPPMDTSTSLATQMPANGIPIGPASLPSRSPSPTRASRNSVLFPCHRAMLLRSEFFLTMFSSGFREAQATPHLQIIPIDCSPAVLEVVLTFLYTEKADFPLDLAIDVLFAADLLLIDRLKQKAAVVISTLGDGTMPPSSQTDVVGSTNHRLADQEQDEAINIFDVVRAGWLTRVPRLEEFGARYFAYRLEDYIDDEDFADLIRESAGRIRGRHETDSIELLDDIRYYLSERFRLRFEEMGMEEMMDEEGGEDEGAAGQQGREGLLKHGVRGLRLDGPTVDKSEGEGEDKEDDVPEMSGAIRLLDGEIAGDEFAGDAINYQILLGKIDDLLDRLKLDA
ncbi:MAG: hypothetical protein Q9207_000751 [Kuettlingeria erythrocarpa]